MSITRPSKTITKKVGCGSIYCTFIQLQDGKFHQLLISGSMSKDTPCGDSWFWGLGKLLTYALRRSLKEGSDITEDAIVKQLKHHQCNKFVAGREKSCISAIGMAIKDYIK